MLRDQPINDIVECAASQPGHRAETREETQMAFLRQLLSRDNKIQIIGTWDL